MARRSSRRLSSATRYTSATRSTCSASSTTSRSTRSCLLDIGAATVAAAVRARLPARTSPRSASSRWRTAAAWVTLGQAGASSGRLREGRVQHRAATTIRRSWPRRSSASAARQSSAASTSAAQATPPRRRFTAAPAIRVDPVTWAGGAAAIGVGEILLTSIDREGHERLRPRAVVRCASLVVVPVIAHGGAGRREDLSGPIARRARRPSLPAACSCSRAGREAC